MLFSGESTCPYCQAELRYNDTSQQVDEWSPIRPKLDLLREELRSVISKSGQRIAEVDTASSSGNIPPSPLACKVNYVIPRVCV